MKNIESYFDMLPYNGNLVRNSNKSGSTQIGPEEYCPESLEIKIGPKFIPEGWTVNGAEPIIPPEPEPEPETSEYDPTKTYEIGDHVYYQGLEYQAIQNVPTNENNQVTDNWDTYWEAVK